jgi:acyl carrier protein
MMEPGDFMSAAAFLMCAVLIVLVTYGVAEALQIRRRDLRREAVDARAPQSEVEFSVAVGAGVTGNVVRAFRFAVGRALGVDPFRLRDRDLLGSDLRVHSFDAIELAAVLERAFDVRVRVMDVVRCRTLADLCRLVHERTLAVSDLDPPLHRDPMPRVAEAEPVAVPPADQPPQA